MQYSENIIEVNLLNFIEKFPDEDSCIAYYKDIRDQVGIKCTKCGHDKHYWNKSKNQFECKRCKYRTTIKKGTVLENSKLPILYWFIAIHLITSTKKTFSASELQRQLGHSRYEPIWEMLHKLRLVMGRRDDEYKLKEWAELDEGFFKIVINHKVNTHEIKRGRGAQHQAKVLVMVESSPIKQENHRKNKKERKVGYVKMKVIENLKADTIERNADNAIEKETTIRTDGFRSYNKFGEKYAAHEVVIAEDQKEVDTLLPWVHTVISNAKRNLLGIHHMIGEDYLQNYLNEFCYKFNRRYFGEQLFDRLLIACASYSINEIR